MDKDTYIEIRKIQKEVAELRNKLFGLESELEEKKNKIFNEIIPKYKHDVKTFNKGDVDENIVIYSKLSNQYEYINYIELFGPIPIAETKVSVKYYIKYNMLFHKGGGHLILEDEIPCSDEEWEEIKKGNIDRFLR